MPIVIEDMTVLVEVNQPSQGTASASASAPATTGNSGSTNQVAEQIRRCVDEVMEVIRQQNER